MYMYMYMYMLLAIVVLINFLYNLCGNHFINAMSLSEYLSSYYPQYAKCRAGHELVLSGISLLGV